MPAGRPSSAATDSSASRQAVAPSFRPAALPAVTCPCGRNGVFRPARPSRGGPGGGGSARGGPRGGPGGGALVDGAPAPAVLPRAGRDGHQLRADLAVGDRLGVLLL